jgi:hypothetical protein
MGAGETREVNRIYLRRQKLDFRKAVLGEIAAPAGHEIVSIDTGLLVRRLLLFDRVVVKSYRFREIPLLVRAFGARGFQTLLDSRTLNLSCEFTSLITDIHRNGQRFAPPQHFTFGIVSASDRESDLKKELFRLQRVPGLKNQKRAEIEEAVWRATVRPSPTFGAELLGQMDSDLRSTSPLLRAAINEQLRKQSPTIDLQKVDITVEEPNERIFHIKTNISEVGGLSVDATHQLLQRSITGVANLNQRIAEMATYSALTGFREDEAPLLFGKLAGILAPQSPSAVEGQFARVIEIVGIPDFKPSQRIDVQKLLEVRNTMECREFRNWLSTAADLSDAEVKRMVDGIRVRLGSFAGSSAGKAVRLVGTTLISMIPVAGLVLGPAAGAVDSFLVEKALPHSGIVAFLSHMYPSLFVAS